MKLHRIKGWACAATVLLGFGFSGAAVADDITVRPGAAPVAPDTSLGDTVVLRGVQPAKPPSGAPATAGGAAPRSGAAPFCPPGFDCSGTTRDYDRGGLNSESAPR